MSGKQEDLINDLFGAEEVEETEEQKPPVETEEVVEDAGKETPAAEEEETEISDSELFEDITPAEESGEEPKEVTPPSLELEDLELSEEQFEEITTSPKAFKEYMEKVAKNAYLQASADVDQKVEQAKQDVLKDIPSVVSKTATRAQEVQGAVTKFFEANPALRERKGYVKDMIALVQTKNPSWNATQVLEEVGVRAKRDIAVTEQAEQREQKRNPAFAGAGGRRAPGGTGDNRTPQQKALDDTFKRN